MLRRLRQMRPTGVRAAINCQLALVSQSRQGGRELKVRMGLHTGHAIPVDGDYTALAVHRAARVSAAAHGGQILCSSQTLDVWRALRRPSPKSCELRTSVLSY